MTNPDLSQGGRSAPDEDRGHFLRFIWLGAWLGMVAGFFEASGLLLCQHMGWSDWRVAQFWVGPQILWISPVFDLLLFGACGLVLDGIVAILPAWIPATRMAAMVLFVLVTYDVTALNARLRPYSVFLFSLGLAIVLTRWFVRHADRFLRLVNTTLPWLAVTTAAVFAIIDGGSWVRERAVMAKLAPPRADAPNIVLIVADTVRADHLSA